MSRKNLKAYGTQSEILTIREGQPRPDAPRLLHVGVHNSANRNAGDTLLFPVVRRAFDAIIGPFNWELRQAWEFFGDEEADHANKHVQGIIIGGGGLLLCDQAGSDIANSGWQWNSTVSAVAKLSIPTIIFAIGYNRFRGQRDFDPIFTDHIQTLVEKSHFFGLRNNGSIRALQNYLLPPLQRSLRHQYCPTTVLWQLYPDYRSMALKHDEKYSRVLAFNMAFDRPEMRFGDRETEILQNVASAIKLAADRGWEINVVAHKDLDLQIEPYLDAVDVPYVIVNLTDAEPNEVIAFYAQTDFVVGMRGHAQMIPFGLRRPILSLVSHDKMRYFLDDIEHPEWAVEVSSPNLSTSLEAMLIKLETSRAVIHAGLKEAQARVWTETVANLRDIGKSIPGASLNKILFEHELDRCK